MMKGDPIGWGSVEVKFDGPSTLEPLTAADFEVKEPKRTGAEDFALRLIKASPATCLRLAADLLDASEIEKDETIKEAQLGVSRIALENALHKLGLR